jgi:8-oxo-dGTP diphosphatase
MVQVAVGFLTYKNKILLMLRDDKPGISSPNCWGLIGGHVEPGEKPDDAIVREVAEETNLKINNKILLFHSEFSIDTGKKEFFFYHIPLTQANIKNVQLMDEGQALEFKTLEELKSLKLSYSLIKYLAEKKNIEILKKIIS